MAKANYYKHKNSWAGRAARAAESAKSNAGSSGRPVLQMDRQPSGDYSWSGDVWTPPVNTGRSGRVPNTGSSGRQVTPPRNWSTPGPENRHYQDQLAAQAWSQAKALALALASLNDGVGLALDLADMGDALSWMLPPGLKGDVQQSTKQFKPIREDNGVRRQLALTDPVNGDWWTFGWPFNTQGGVNYQNTLSIWEVTPLSQGDWDPNKPQAEFLGWLPAQTWNLGAYGSSVTQNWAEFGQTGQNMTMWQNNNNEFIQNNTLVNGMGVDFTGYTRLGTDIYYDIILGPFPSEAAARAAGEQRLAQQRRGYATVPQPYRPIYPASLIDDVNFLKQAFGVQTYDGPLFEDGTGVAPSGVTIIPPKGPPISFPDPSWPHKPPAGTKEKKARATAGLLRVAQSIFHQITEYGDLVDALVDAVGPKAGKPPKGLAARSLWLFEHVHDIDVGDAIVNIAWNQFEDYAIGKGLFGTNVAAARARGDRYAFRTLNSANGYGGLDELGELYGDFSQQYVEPRKDDLKRYLSDRFGL